MLSWFVVAAAGAFVGAAVFWNLAVVAALRFFGVSLPFSLPFHFFKLKQPEVLKALPGRSINTYVLISGLLLFACPLLVGVSAYDYVVGRYLGHATTVLNYAVGLAAWVVLLVVGGVRISIGHWQKSEESGIGFAMLAILAVKIATDTVGALTVVVLLGPAALSCFFIYFGIRRIRGASAGRRYPSRREVSLENNFIGEQFVPSERYKAQQAAAQELMAAGSDAEGSVIHTSVEPNSDEKPSGR
jgi:hypothetical protein